jgi:hypothetical protein
VKEDHPYSSISLFNRGAREENRQERNNVEESHTFSVNVTLYYKELQAIGFNLIYRHIVNSL